MPSRSRLTPTPIVDKNGRATTVHRKMMNTGSPVTAPAPQLPAPATFDRTTVINALAEGYAAYSNVGSSLYRDLDSFPDDVLSRLWELQIEFPKPMPTTLAFMVKRRVVHRGGLSGVREGLRFFPALVGKYTYRTIDQMVDGLHKYRQLPACEDFSQESETVQSQCEALLRVHCELLGLPRRSRVSDPDTIFDAALVDLILEEHQRADQIARIITERNSFDTVMIREVLASDSTALGNGVL